MGKIGSTKFVGGVGRAGEGKMDVEGRGVERRDREKSILEIFVNVEKFE